MHFLAKVSQAVDADVDVEVNDPCSGGDHQDQHLLMSLHYCWSRTLEEEEGGGDG